MCIRDSYTPAALELNDPDWTEDTNGNATIDLTGVTIAPGESSTVDITMTILSAGDIENQAEISDAAAVDASGNPILGPDGLPLGDADSVADADNSDVLADGVLNNAGDDEDDHDVAGITVAAPPAEPAPVLAFTGVESRQLALAALLILGAGIGIVSMTGARRRESGS